MDLIEKYAEEAHAIINETSMFEVIDLERKDAEIFLNKHYPNLTKDKIVGYLHFVEKFRQEIS